MVIYNVTFSIINDTRICKTSKGSYILGIFKCKEDHSNLKIALKELNDQLKYLDEILVNEKLIKICKTFTSDLKAQASAFGIYDATSKYPCTFCTIGFNLVNKKKVNAADIDLFKQTLEKEWSYIDIEKGARTHEESSICVNKTNIDDKYINLFLTVFLLIDVFLICYICV